MSFGGTKIALFLGDELLAYRRDDKPEIPFPNFWDLPGGGREGEETPFECAQREVFEEFGFLFEEVGVVWRRTYISQTAGTVSHFMVGHLTPDHVQSVQFGDEGQEWRMMPVEEFLSRADAVPQLQARLRDYLDGRSA